MYFCKNAFHVCCIIACAACQHTSKDKVSFAGSEHWMLQPYETVHVLDKAIFDLYEKHQLISSHKAPLSKYIRSDRYQVYISLLSEEEAYALHRVLQTDFHSEYRVLAQDSAMLVRQHPEQHSMYRYLLGKPDSTYLYSIAYDAYKLNFSVLINIVTKDSSLAYQIFKDPDFITKRLGNVEFVVDD